MGNIMTSLREIFETQLTLRSDKWLPYFDVYETFFSRYRERFSTFVEVGVQGGGSMQMWRKYFGTNAKIYGIDIDPAVRDLDLSDANVTIIVGDQTKSSFWDSMLHSIGTIDMFLDDGGHTMDQQINTLLAVWPAIAEGGVYVCEDLHTSYWSSHGGGFRKPETMIEMCKSLIDLMHINHISDAEPPAQLLNLFSNVGSIHFYDSIVVLTKGKPEFVRKIVNDV